MMNNSYLAGFVVLSLAWHAACRPADEPSALRGTLTVMADESLVPLMEEETAQFGRLYPEIKASVLGSSTRGAIVSLLNDSVSAIVIDRPLNAEEQQVVRQASFTLSQTDFAIDGLSVLVHRDNPVASLEMKHLQEILDRKVTRWDARGRSWTDASVRIVTTGPNSGVFELLSKHFFSLTQPLIPDKVLNTQQDVVEALAQDPHAMGIISHSYYARARRDSALSRIFARVRVVPLVSKDSAGTVAVIPSQRSLYLKEYPLNFTVSLVSNERRVGPAAGLASFLTSLPGQKIVQDAGLLPVKVPVRPIQLTQEQLQ
jgi:phosphate transport system substrate-binding protein